MPQTPRLIRNYAHWIATAALSAFVALSVSHRSLAGDPETPPFGNYLWYPEPGGPKSEADCEVLVSKLKPTDEMVRQWQWGQIPNDDFAHMPFFLIVSPGRIETTFAAEGDFDTGDVVFEQSLDGETAFTLTPDDHPAERIKGKIAAMPESKIVTLTLFDVPLDDDARDRVSYYCRFEDAGTEI